MAIVSESAPCRARLLTRKLHSKTGMPAKFFFLYVFGDSRGGCGRLVYGCRARRCYNSRRLQSSSPQKESSMTTPSTHNVTQLLVAWSDGDQAALEKLMPLVYQEL